MMSRLSLEWGNKSLARDAEWDKKIKSLEKDVQELKNVYQKKVQENVDMK